jgi:predicted DNA-binding protein (MmcQ/YjbR family)
MAPKPATRLRQTCLGLPDATEVIMRRGPSYRIADKIFALARPRGGEMALWCKVPAGSQAVLIGADAQRFFVPPYFGPKGWVGVVLDRSVDWNEVAALVERSYRLVAPKRRRT